MYIIISLLIESTFLVFSFENTVLHFSTEWNFFLFHVNLKNLINCVGTDRSSDNKDSNMQSPYKPETLYYFV